MRWLLLAVIPIAAPSPAETLDRIAVTVGTHVITESALELELRITAFLDQTPVDRSPEAKRRAADRLVEQALILREAADSHLALPSEDDANALLRQVKLQFPSAPAYELALQRYGISEEELKAHLLAGLQALTFTDLRFRPAAQVSEEDLRAYYASLGETEGFEARRDEVEALLLRQRVWEALDAWLKETRAATRIQYREQVFR
jgi:hypothetical protein